MSFTNAEKAECAERELRQRRRVYPRFIEQNKMSQSFADSQIAMMEEIANDYHKLAQGERLL